MNTALSLIKTDKRQTYRIAVTEPFRVTVEHGNSHADEPFLTDLSESGCLLQCQRAFQTGERVTLVLELPQPVRIAEARIVWSNGTRCGLEFVRVSPIERARLWRFLWKPLSRASDQ